MTFWRNYYHIVWATKNREPSLDASIEPVLYDYLVHKTIELGVFVYAINGWFDHVHVIVAIPPKLCVAELVKMIKGSSSHYINHIVRPEHLQFAWQRGYGCLTLGETQRNHAIAYVENQKKHHQENTSNAWLERCDELDEGPIDMGINQHQDERILREDIGEYQEIIDPWLF